MVYHDLGGPFVEMPDRENQRVARFVFQEQLRLRKKEQGE
jgi:c-di-GMP-binding flagellar brake protein YcgR